MMRTITISIPLLVSFLLCPVLWAEQHRGSVCIAPNSSTPPIRVSPGQMYNPATLSIRIDKRPVVLWPHKECLKVEGLDITQRHLFVVISDGKPLLSFWFRFADYKSTELCVSFDGYQGVQVKEPREVRWCKCN